MSSVNSPRTSRIVEARRSRYGTTQQTSPNSSSSSLLKSLSKEALLHIPLSQLNSEDALSIHNSSSSASTASSTSSSPSPTHTSVLSSEISPLNESLGTSLSPSLIRLIKSGTWGNSGSSIQHNREFTEEEKVEVYQAIINSEIETLPHLCALLQVKFVSFIPLPSSKQNRATSWLHLAASECTKDSKKLFDYLLKTKADSNQTVNDNYYHVNDKNANGWTPLHEAAHAGNFNAVVSLLDHGADVSLANSDSALPLHYFVKHDFSNERGCSEDLYTLYNTVERLLGEGGKLVNCLDNRKATALHYACMAKQEECVRLLIRNSAKLDILDKNEQTPLHYAIMARATTLIKILVEAGADIANLPTPSSSPLQIAREFPEILALLQPNKAPPRAATFSSLSGAGDPNRQRVFRTGSHTTLPTPAALPTNKLNEIRLNSAIGDPSNNSSPRKPPRPASKRDGGGEQSNDSSTSPASSPQLTRGEAKQRRPVSVVHRLPPDLSKE